MLAIFRVALRAWRTRGWRKIDGDPPPIGVQVLGLCQHTGVRSVTARREDVPGGRWENWYINWPTHWRAIAEPLELSASPPASEPVAYITIKESNADHEY